MKPPGGIFRYKDDYLPVTHCLQSGLDLFHLGRFVTVDADRLYHVLFDPFRPSCLSYDILHAYAKDLIFFNANSPGITCPVLPESLGIKFAALVFHEPVDENDVGRDDFVLVVQLFGDELETHGVSKNSETDQGKNEEEDEAPATRFSPISPKTFSLTGGARMLPDGTVFCHDLLPSQFIKDNGKENQGCGLASKNMAPQGTGGEIVIVKPAYFAVLDATFRTDDCGDICSGM